MFRRRILYPITIKEKVIITCQPKIYNGQTQVASNLSVIMRGVTLTEGVDYIIINNNGGVNVGTYSFTVKGIGDYWDSEESTFDIVKVTPTVTIPTPKTNLVYDGTPKALINNGSTNFGTLKYSLDGNSYSTAIPSGTDATNYTIYYKVDGDGANINDVPAQTIVSTINKAQCCSTAPTAISNIVYNGNAKPLINAGSSSCGTMQYNVDGGTYSTSIPTGTNAKTGYTVGWKVVNDANHSGTCSGTVSVNIAKANGSVQTPPSPIPNLIYNASAQTLVIAGSGTGTMMYKLDSGSWGTTIPSGTNATSYTVYYKASASTNYNESASGSVKCSISPVTPTVVAPTPKVLTYNTSAQVLANAGNTDWGIMEYNIDGGNWTTSVPSATNANVKYSVGYRVSGNTNINSVSPKYIECVINEKKVTTPTITISPISYTYNGSTQTPTTVTVKDGSTVIPASEYTVTYYNNLNAGTATLTINDNTAGNYYISGQTTFEIAKAACCSTAPTSKSGLVYNRSAQAVVNAGSSSCGTIQYNVNDGSYTNAVPSGTSAGNYTVKWKVVNDANHSGTCSGTVSTVTIAKATPVINVTPSFVANWTYDASAHNLLSGGTVKHSSTDSTAVAGTFTYTKQTNIGTYKTADWNFTPTDTTNYNSINGTVSNNTGVTVNCKPCTAPTAKNPNWTGSAQNLVNAGSTTYGTMVYSTDNSTWSTTIPQGTNAGSYTVYWKVTGNTNVCCTESSSVACSIKKVAMSYTAPSATTYTYANTARNSASGGSATGGSIQYCTTSGGTYSTTIPTNTNVGSYDVWWKAVPDGNHSGGTSAAKLTAKINCYSATAPTAKNGNWSGSAQNLVNAGSTSYGTMVYCSTSGGTYSTTIPQGTNAGSYEVWWKVTGNTNVCNTAATKVACSIKKVAMTYTAPSAATRNYNGSAQQIVSGQSAAGGSIYYATSSAGASSSTTVPTQTNVGSYNTWWKAVPDSNHSGGTSSWAQLTGTINKVAMTSCTPTAKSVTYNGSSQAIVTDCTPTGGDIYYATSNAGANSGTTVPSQTNVGTWTYYWKAIPDSNHSGGTSSWAQITGCKINQASLTITAKAQTINYGGSITTGTGQVTVTGLANGDSLTSITLTPSTSNVPGGVITPSAGATSKGIGNYSVTYNTGTLTINKVAMTYTAPKAAVRTYNGSAQQIVSGQSAAGGSIYFATSNAGANSGTTVPTRNAFGSTDTWWRAVPDSNHSGGTSSWAKLTGQITQKALTITAKAQTVNYGTSITQGTGQTTTDGLVGGDALTAITLTQSTTIVPGGVITPSAAATRNGISNYSVTYKTGTLTINKVAMTCCTPTAKSLVFNGYYQAIVNDCTPTGGDIYYATDSNGANSGTSVPTQGNVGTWTYYYKCLPDNNHSGGSNSWTAISDCKITQKALTITAKAQTVTYGTAIATGTSQVTTDGLVGNDSLTYILLSQSTTDVTNTGTITPSNGLIDEKVISNYSVTYKTGTLTINKKNVVCTAPTKKNLTYNKSSQNLVNAGACEGGSITYCLTSGGTYSTSIPVGTNAGNYTVWYKCTATNSNYSGTCSGSVACSIAKKAMTYTAPKAATRTYNCSAQQIVSGQSSEGCTIYYATSSAGASSSTTVPTQTNAGTYSIWWSARLSDSTNYSGSNTSWAQVTNCKINQKTNATISYATTAVTKTYGDAAFTNALTKSCSSCDGSVSYSASNTSACTVDSSGKVTIKAVGSCTIKATVTNGTNCAYSTNAATYNITVNKAAMTYTAPKVATRTYNGTAQQIVSGQSANGGSIYYATSSAGASSSTTVPTATNTGTSYSTYWKAVPDGNHSGGTSSWAQITGCKITQKALTITAKAQTVTWGTAITKNTGQTTTDGLVSGDALTAITLTQSTTNVTTAGTITPLAAATKNGISNYAVTYKTGTLTINKKTGCAISFATTAITKTYGDVAFTNAITNTGDGSITWSSSNTGVCTVNSSGQVTIKAAGSCTISATTTNTSNCTYSTTAATYKITVNKATGKVSTVPTAKSLTYNKSAQSLVNAGSGTGTMMYKLDSGSWVTAIPSATNAGSYTVYYKASASTNYNESASGSVSCSIAKKAGSYTAPSAATRVYNGTAQQIVSGQSAEGFSIYYATSSAGASSSTTVPTQTNVGAGGIWWKPVLTDTTNYSASTAPPTSWAQVTNCKITQKTLIITAKAQTVTWGTTIAKNTGQTTTDGLVGGDALTAITLTQSTTNVTTTGTITPSAAATRNGISNYSVSYKTGTLTINKKTGCVIVFETTAVTKTYGDAVFTNAISNSGDGHITWSSSNTGVCTVNSSGQVTIKAAGSCTISATTTNTSNCTYSTTAATYSITVNKAAMTYTAPSAATRVYNGTYQQIVSGQSANGGSIQFCSTASGTYSTTVPTQTYTGTSYSTFWKAVPDSNHSGGTNPAQITNCKITQKALTITAKAQTVTWGTAITKNTGQTTTDGLVSGDALIAITLTQSTTNVTTAGTITPSAGATNKGISNYAVTYKTGTLTINKKTGCAISFATTAITKTYGDAVFTNAISNSGDGSRTWSSSNTGVCTVNSSGQVTIKAAGSCTISATTTNTSNCTYSTTAATYSITVNKKAISNVTITLSQDSMMYNSAVQKPTVTVKSGSDTLTLNTHYTLSWSNSSSTNVGEYSVSAVPTSNYSFTVVSGKYMIYPYTPTLPTAKSLTYNTSAQALINAGSTSYGTMQYSGGTNGTTWSTTIPSGTTAGTYTVGWRISGNTNVSPQSGTVSTTIAKANRTISDVTPSTITPYPGSRITFSITTSAGGGTGYLPFGGSNYYQILSTGEKTLTVGCLTGGTNNVSVSIGINEDANYKSATATTPSLSISNEYNKEYLTFIATASGTFKFTKAVSYSLNYGISWVSLAANTNSPTVSANTKIMWKATSTPASGTGVGTFSSTAAFTAEGNPMSLLYGDNFSGQTSLSGKNYAFQALFSGCTRMTSAANLVLPATTLSDYCYSQMFKGCTSLTTNVPIVKASVMKPYCCHEMYGWCTGLTNVNFTSVITAKTAAEHCCESMFRKCSSLTTNGRSGIPFTTLAPYCCQWTYAYCTSLTSLYVNNKASTLAEGCYSEMCRDCTSLTTAPALSCTTLADRCYQAMFSSCTSLTGITSGLPATTITNYCYQYMFSDCTSLVTAPELPATVLKVGCYQKMFKGCSKLNSITCKATTFGTNSTLEWVDGVASSGTFKKSSSATGWSTGISGIPSGWATTNV